MSVARKFVFWIFLSIILITLMWFMPLPRVGSILPTSILLIAAALMGLFRRAALKFLLPVIGISLVLPIIVVYLIIFFGCLGSGQCFAGAADRPMQKGEILPDLQVAPHNHSG